MYTFFLGTNTALSAGEIAAVLLRLGVAFTVETITEQFVRISSSEPLPTNLIKNLGGTIRISEDVATWNHMPSAEEIVEALQPLPPKWDMGIGQVSMSLNIRKVGIEVKKAARQQGSKVSFVEPKAGASLLNAAQVIFNKLTSLPNAELIFMKSGENIILVRTVAVQDITTYELRDTLRPARDARVGLLPPKLAQIMINLGLPRTPENTPTVYDPFCGMGTILQEAWLMGFASIGTDISERMVSSAHENIEYLSKQFSVSENLKPLIFHHDATSPAFPEDVRNKKLTIVTEPFLGTPLSRPLSPTEATQFYESVTPLYHQFFTNIKSILTKNSRLLVLLPAPRIRENGKDTFTPLPRIFLDEIAKVGYRKAQLIPKEISDVSTAGITEPVLYARPDALIARELTLWERV
jgi:tRNA G10  N-methylase Trm11